MQNKDFNFGTVATHSGAFHADDVFAIASLKLLNPDIFVYRSRDKRILDYADMRVDVGGKYCFETLDFDHHQKDGAGCREDGFPYASFGLIWKHYGPVLCESKSVASIIDKKLVQRIDGVDNGYLKITGSDYTLVSHVKCPSCNATNVDRNKLVLPFPLHDAINSFNPSWQEINPDRDKAFNRAVEFATEILSSTIKNVQSQETATEIVRTAISESEGDYLVLPKFCPWQETTINESDAKYVIHPNPEGKWMAWAVPTQIGGRDNRHYFPKEWAGLKDESLQGITGIKDAEFCHDKRFVATAKTVEGAKQLVKNSLEYKCG